MKNKFRAYDKWNRCFIPSYQVAVNSEGDVYVQESSEGYTRKVDSIEILEYSGKKDRNGVELYKGDIVKAGLNKYTNTARYHEYLPEKTIFGVVVIRPSEGARILVKKIIPEGVVGITKGRVIRIKEDSDIRIGHVYINPEVLE
jgi:uncharacterized phage protein (TIGR01671 family)